MHDSNTQDSTSRRRRIRPRAMVAAVVLTGCLAYPAVAAATPVAGGAHALQGHVDVLGIVPADVGPLPSVTLPESGGGPITASLLSTTLLGLVTVGAAPVSTQGSTTSGTVDSSARVANVDIAGLVTAKLVESSCSATTSGATGAAKIVDLVVAGIPIAAVDLGPNTTISLPVGSVVINEQTRTSSAPAGPAAKATVRKRRVSSRSKRRSAAKRVARTRAAGPQGMTVNAVHVKLSVLGLANVDVTLAQSRCRVG